MDSLQWYDYLRIFNGLLAVTTCYLIAKRARRDWATYTQRLKEFSWAMQAFLILTLLGSLEQVLQNVPYGSRMILTTIVVLGTFRAAIRPEGLIKEKP